MLTNTDFMIICGEDMKKGAIKEFNDTKTLASVNKKNLKSLCNTYFIRMLRAKMKILNGYLKTDIDYMQKEHEIFKKYASMCMEEYEDKEGTVIEINDDIATTDILENQGAYLHLCNIIKAEYDLVEDYMETAKKMDIEGFHFD